MKNIFDKILDSDFLTERRKKIFRLIISGLTFREVGEQMGLSKQRISQLMKIINQKVKNNLSEQEFEVYIKELKINQK